MKIDLPSPRKPAPVTPKQGSLYHEMGESPTNPSDLLFYFLFFEDKTKQTGFNKAEKATQCLRGMRP